MQTTTHPIRVLIADDHAVLLEGLAAMIGRQDDMVVVADACDGEAAVEAWNRHRPDVTLLDLRMPRMGGVEVITLLRAREPGARFIVLTTFDTDEDIYQAIKAGAAAYLLKDIRREELLECIRRVHAGETCISPALVSKLAGRVGQETLTGRELEVLGLLAAGLSNKEIGRKLYISEATVKTHVRGVFAKLNVISRTEAISAATKRGLVKL